MSIALLLLLIVPLASAILLFVVPRKKELIDQVAFVGTTLTLLTALWLTWQVAVSGIVSVSAYLTVDPLGALMILFAAIVGWASTWFAARHLQHERAKNILGLRRIRQHYGLLLLFLLALFVAAATPNLMLMWVAIEATTLTTVLLISFYHRPAATEAAWKYLIVNSVGLLVSLLGILLFMATLTHWAFPTQGGLVPVAAHNSLIVKIAFILTLVGYGTKAGIVPLHTWKPDAYSLVPVPVGAVMSTALLNIALMAIIRLKTLTDTALAESFTGPIILVFSLLSIIVAAALIVAQRNYKRLIAYSSIEHTGLMLFGISLGPAGQFLALLHMLYHTLGKAALFLASGSILVAYSSSRIANVRGMLKNHPLLAGVVLAAVVLVLGLPPFGMFTTEWLLLLTAFSTHPYLVIFFVAALVVAFAGFVWHISTMVFRSSDLPISPLPSFRLADAMPIIVLLVLAFILSWYLPSWLKLLLTAASHSL